ALAEPVDRPVPRRIAVVVGAQTAAQLVNRRGVFDARGLRRKQRAGAVAPRGSRAAARSAPAPPRGPRRSRRRAAPTDAHPTAPLAPRSPATPGRALT